jgi:hypothetical protein
MNSRSTHIDPILLVASPGPRWNMVVNDRIDDYIFIGTSAEFVKTYLKVGAKLQPIQMFGYWVNSVTVDEVDQLELEQQDYD